MKRCLAVVIISVYSKNQTNNSLILVLVLIAHGAMSHISNDETEVLNKVLMEEKLRE